MKIDPQRIERLERKARILDAMMGEVVAKLHEMRNEIDDIIAEPRRVDPGKPEPQTPSTQWAAVKAVKEVHKWQRDRDGTDD